MAIKTINPNELTNVYKELSQQKIEKEKLLEELNIAYKELAYQK